MADIIEGIFREAPKSVADRIKKDIGRELGAVEKYIAEKAAAGDGQTLEVIFNYLSGLSTRTIETLTSRCGIDLSSLRSLPGTASYPNE